MAFVVAGIIVIAVVVNVLLWLFLMPRYVERRISGFQNELVDRHYDEVEVMYRKMRGWRHDYHNHIQVLKAYLSLTQYREALDYLDGLEKDLSAVDTVLKTGNVMVDAILNSKLSLIRERKIAVDATALVPGDAPVSGIDLSVLIGNLLDNAMEACMELPPQERLIRVYMEMKGNYLYFALTNTAKGEKKHSFRSTKGKGHGLGLSRVDAAVKKYGGYVTRASEDGAFSTEILLPQ